tara:strand:- start:29079 stop:29408 length:330 start_codon:yes stop_codon:yes gene_type:complete
MIPKYTKHNRIKPKRSDIMNAAEKRHADRIASMPCLVCGSRQVHVHHVKDGPGGRRDHRHIAPLCPDHHLHGKDAVHRISRADFNELIGFDLLEWCKEQWKISEDMEDE